jgi:hypothetical protein
MPTVDISAKAFAFLQSRAVPLKDTAETVLDRILSEFEALSGKSTQNESAAIAGLVFSGNNIPSFKFTDVISAKINGKNASQRYWNNILEDCIAFCAQKKITSSDIMKHMKANVQAGRFEENGYRYVESADISFQGLEANRIIKNLVSLSTQFEIPIDVRIKWQNKEGSAYPGQEARFVLP